MSDWTFSSISCRKKHSPMMKLRMSVRLKVLNDAEAKSTPQFVLHTPTHAAIEAKLIIIPNERRMMKVVIIKFSLQT